MTTPPEHFAAVADRILADILTGQPAQDPRQGAAMNEPQPPDDYDHAAVLTQVEQRRRRNAEAVANLPHESALDLARRRLAEQRKRRADGAGQLDLGGA